VQDVRPDAYTLLRLVNIACAEHQQAPANKLYAEIKAMRPRGAAKECLMAAQRRICDALVEFADEAASEMELEQLMHGQQSPGSPEPSTQAHSDAGDARHYDLSFLIDVCEAAE